MTTLTHTLKSSSFQANIEGPDPRVCPFKNPSLQVSNILLEYSFMHLRVYFKDQAL